MPVLEELTSLILNRVDNMDTFKKMIEAGIVKDNELYLVLEAEDSYNSITIDEEPTEGSENLVYSGGVWKAIQESAGVNFDVLPIEMGGTGATTVEGARENLEVSSTEEMNTAITEAVDELPTLEEDGTLVL